MLNKLESIAIDIKAINNRFETLEQRLNNIEDEMDTMKEDIDEIRNEENSKNPNGSTGNETMQNLKGEIQQLRHDMADFRENHDELINRSKRCNLVFSGVKQDGAETWEQTEEKVKDIIKGNLEIDRNINFERVHRILNGPIVNGSKLIVAMFSCFKDKEEVLRKARKLKGTDIYIEQDFSRRTRVKRKKLFALRKKLQEREDIAKTIVTHDKLVVTMADGIRRIFACDGMLGEVKEVDMKTA
ncbi:uncharacterized protein [Ptychodera flava]|uniref:uncharacterized protein n=1 Tax=Ptychodera flava TaxID=63121 RepID=UPI00396A0D89